MRVFGGSKSAKQSKPPRAAARGRHHRPFQERFGVVGDWLYALDKCRDRLLPSRLSMHTRTFSHTSSHRAIFIFTKFCTCSVTPGSRGLAGAVNTRAPAVPALRMADVAEATEAAADPTVMRPPIDMPWESISDQVRRGHLIAAPSIELCNSRNSGMLLRYPHTT